MSWTISILGASALLLGFLIWQEIRRVNRAALIGRLAATITAVVALVCLALPITYSRNIQDQHKKLALITEGYQEHDIDTLKHATRITNSRAIAQKHNQKPITFIADADLLRNAHPDISGIDIFGYGLPGQELKKLAGLAITFHPAEVPPGLRSVYWRKTIRLGQQLRVQGSVHPRKASPCKLLLKAGLTTVDSTVIKATTIGKFELKTTPKYLGRATYELLILQGSDTLAKEQLPVQVEDPEPLRILTLSSAPDFETKFLSNWLYAEGYSIAVRTTISKGKLSTTFLNHEKLGLATISPQLLQKFDVVIADMAELSSLEATEAGALRREISRGLGLIILNPADSLAKRPSFSNMFRVQRAPLNAAKPAPLMLPLAGDKTAPILTPEYYVSGQAGELPLAENGTGAIVASTKLYGAGKISVNTLTNSYTWKLAGNTNSFELFWAALISQTARKQADNTGWLIASALPRVNDELKLIAVNAPLLPVRSEQGDFYPAHDPTTPFLATGKFWAGKPGWVSFKQDDGKTTWQYIYTGQSWSTIKATELVEVNRRFASLSPQNKETNLLKPVNETVSKLWFLLLFIAACTFLWYESKMR